MRTLTEEVEIQMFEKQKAWPKEWLFAVSFGNYTMLSTKEGEFWIIGPPRFAIELANMFIERL